jgi:hypothetical protein
MPGDRVRNFVVKYQDRIAREPIADFRKRPEVIKEWEEQYAKDWRYTSQPVTS